jgi:large subunit ribosomal protein L25
VRFELQAEGRDGFRRSGARKLRRLGRIPAIVYGGGRAPEAISLDHDAVVHQMDREAFYTSILSIVVGTESQPVVVKEVQRHPAKPYVLHLDFQRIVEDEEITLNVPIHFIGEDTAKGVKEQGGVVEHLMTDLEISCLPKDLPEYLEVDVTALELNEVLHLSEIRLPEGVTSVALDHGQNPPVVAINPPRREEEEEEAIAEEAAAAEVPAGEVPTTGEAEEEESGD